jgi:hypothetical protein
MTSQTKLIKDLIFKMVQVTTKLNGRSLDPDLDINALVFHKHDSNNQLRNRYINVFEK